MIAASEEGLSEPILMEIKHQFEDFVIQAFELRSKGRVQFSRLWIKSIDSNRVFLNFSYSVNVKSGAQDTSFYEGSAVLVRKEKKLWMVENLKNKNTQFLLDKEIITK